MNEFRFGIYKGIEIDKVCHYNPKYCLWCDDNVKGFTLTEEQRKVAEKRKREIEDAKAQWAEDAFGFGGNGLWDASLD